MRNCGFFGPKTPLVVAVFTCQPKRLCFRENRLRPSSAQIQLAFFRRELYFRRMSLTQNLLDHPDQFVRRHIGPNAAETSAMLALLGHNYLDELTNAAVPAKIRLEKKLNLPAARSEFDALAELRRIASENKVFRSFIGQGYYDCITPPVIQRNVLENR